MSFESTTIDDKHRIKLPRGLTPAYKEIECVLLNESIGEMQKLILVTRKQFESLLQSSEKNDPLTSWLRYNSQHVSIDSHGRFVIPIDNPFIILLNSALAKEVTIVCIEPLQVLEIWIKTHHDNIVDLLAQGQDIPQGPHDKDLLNALR